MKNRKSRPLLLLACTVVLPGLLIMNCGSSGIRNPEIDFARVDSSITDTVAFSDLTLDSITIERFLINHNTDALTSKYIRNFYRSRNYHFAWFTKEGLAEQALAFWNLHNNYVRETKDSSLYDKKLHSQMDSLVNEEAYSHYSGKEIEEIELHLTQHFFEYAHYAYEGKIDPSQLQWHIPRKKIDAVKLLDSLLAYKGEQPEKWEPVNLEYRKLRSHLALYDQIEKNGGWPQIIVPGNKALKKGDTSAAISSLKKRLHLEGDYPENDLTGIFTPALETAVLRAQKRFGLLDDGIAGPATLRELNVSAKQRIEQILINMERMRWMPAEDTGTRLVVNIPEFRLHVYNGDNELFNMKIVAGKATHNTVVFNDELEYVVLSPYWNVPASIVRKEILPAIRRNRNYLQQNHMEITGSLNGLPVIRQKPGDDNALGRVKFLFPNNYHIYLHDTPAKNLFEQTTRAFSHGCIRLERAKELAQFLLRNEKEWNPEKIEEAMSADVETWVPLAHKVPVYIVYFTAWVDNNGLVNFREDIYGNDKKLEKQLFTN